MLYNITLALFVLPLKDINYELFIINLSLIVIMKLLCCYKVLGFIPVAILLVIDFANFAKADNYADNDYNYDRYQYPDSISKAEISELIETKTKMMGTEIELIKAKTELLEAKTKLLEAKSLSEAEIIKLIKSNSIGSGKLIDCPVDNPLFQIVGGTCVR